VGQNVVLGVAVEDMVMSVEDCLIAKPFNCSHILKLSGSNFISSCQYWYRKSAI
jgi:hypothetical protein